jgi:ribosomal protein S18 acetylase RimI-like enzyme
MKIRILKVEELEVVKNLAYRIWPIAYKEILSQEQLEFMLNWMYSIQTLQENWRNGHFFFAISMDEQDVGFLDLEPNNPIEGNMKIQKIYVLPEFQGMGLGYELMKQAFNFAKENQMNSMTLQVNRNNKAVEFYKKFGFEIIDEQDFDIGNGYYMNDFIMRFKIN